MAQAAHPSSQLAVVRRRRIAGGWWATGAAACLVVARMLTPSPTGYGTHLQVIPIPCLWRAVTGLPCPSCGLTTALAWMARGEIARAWHSNPCGPFVYLAAWVFLAWGLLAAAFGVADPGEALNRRPVIAGVICMYIAVWLVRLAWIWLGAAH